MGKFQKELIFEFLQFIFFIGIITLVIFISNINF